jgi:Nucleotidyl transferase AbiEii toxin, Type IV TA system
VRFVHDDPDFPELLAIVAKERNLAPGLVEKDYWVTHALWALQAGGLEIWFKGGTSLSKGFGLVERFSEDLDLKIEPGNAAWLPRVSNWRSEGTKATATRRAYFEALAKRLRVPGSKVTLDPDAIDGAWRSATLRVTYPGRHLADLGAMAPFVRLEVGSARVTPFVARDMTSFVHEKLLALGQLGDFEDNRPRGVRCVHPLVTLLEKLDALHRRFPNTAAEPAAFVRHYEDAARIIRAQAGLPLLDGYSDAAALAADMLAQKQVAALPVPEDPAFAPGEGPRWDAVRAAHAAIAPLFWGQRIPLDEACAVIRAWVAEAVR